MRNTIMICEKCGRSKFPKREWRKTSKWERFKIWLMDTDETYSDNLIRINVCPICKGEL
jgi:hypothetical protein